MLSSRISKQVPCMRFRLSARPACCTAQSPCCGEFIVSSERVKAHSKEQYQLLLDRLVALQPLRKHQKNKKEADGFRAAYVLEQAWCVFFLDL